MLRYSIVVLHKQLLSATDVFILFERSTNMSGCEMVFFKKMNKWLQVGLLCGMMAFLAACGAKDTEPGDMGDGSDQAASEVQAPDGGTQSGGAVQTSPAGNKRELVYGITVQLPEGWMIGSSADVGVADDKKVKDHIAKGERIGILDIYRTNKDGSKEPTGRISMYLVDASKNFMPEAEASRLTPEACEQFGKMLMQREHEMAASKKAKSPILDWKLFRESINGKLALVHQGLAGTPTGKVNIVNADIYLPNGVGLAVKSAANAEPGTEQVLRNFIRSIQIAR